MLGSPEGSRAPGRRLDDPVRAIGERPGTVIGVIEPVDVDEQGRDLRDDGAESRDLRPCVMSIAATLRWPRNGSPQRKGRPSRMVLVPVTSLRRGRLRCGAY